uniref:Uncharacterized protein n=1 Tax=Zea mays TaxID=4577 RepID=B4G0R3_MAIZE|nr:unknown [Zea mays]
MKQPRNAFTTASLLIIFLPSFLSYALFPGPGGLGFFLPSFLTCCSIVYMYIWIALAGWLARRRRPSARTLGSPLPARRGHGGPK